jgi:hypothetical protein
MGGELWTLQGCGHKCFYSFPRNLLNAKNNKVYGKSNDFKIKQYGRHF